jgi:hypothetical protein
MPIRLVNRPWDLAPPVRQASRPAVFGSSRLILRTLQLIRDFSNALGRDVRALREAGSGTGNENTNDDLDWPIIHPPLKPSDQTAHCQADQNAASGQEEQLSHAFSMKDSVRPVTSILSRNCNASRPVPSFTRLSAS